MRSLLRFSVKRILKPLKYKYTGASAEKAKFVWQYFPVLGSGTSDLILCLHSFDHWKPPSLLKNLISMYGGRNYLTPQLPNFFFLSYFIPLNLNKLKRPLFNFDTFKLALTPLVGNSNAASV